MDSALDMLMTMRYTNLRFIIIIIIIISVTKQTRDYLQLSNIMGHVCVSSGNLCSVIGQDSVADTLNTPA